MTIKNAKVLTLVSSVGLVTCVFLGMNVHGVHAASDAPQSSGAYQQMDVFGEVMRHIQTDYVVDPNMGAVTGGAMRGLLESLDADSSYLSPADYKTYRDAKGGKAQTGIDASKRFGYATVVSVVPGSPADKANLGDGDWIEAIDGHDTRDLSLAMIRLMLEGAPGSQVTLSVIRPRKADPDKVVLTRASVAEPAVADSMYEGNSILYLKPEILDKEHVSQVENKLKGMGRFGNKKVLLDLRDVSGGEVSEALRLTNLFLTNGTITSLEGQKFPKQTFAADASKAVAPSVPVVVLVNGGTAGPAEIVAAALQDNKRAELVGVKTFGEGAQQKTFELPDGSALILSVAKYESPLGKKLQDDAVTPGIVVAVSPDALLGPDDSDKTKKAAATVDDQLTKALEVLKAKSA